MEKITVNALGEQCPIPVVKTLKVLNGLTGPASVEVLVDNANAVQNVTRMVTNKGIPVRSEKQAEGRFALYFEVQQAPETAPEPEPACAPDRRGDQVVAITSDCMGRGNDELGRTLMKGFLYALSQREKLPKTILFYNGGARLTTEGSLSLEDLKSMEAQGVEILTCGTCLNYYGLGEKLAVGGVTNMYQIVEILSKAGRILRP